MDILTPALEVLGLPMRRLSSARRYLPLSAVVFFVAVAVVRGEIHDVMKSSEIDKTIAQGKQSVILQKAPNHAVVLRVYAGKPSPPEMDNGADEVWFVRQGNAKVSLGSQKYEVSGGDLVNVPRKTPYQVDPGTGKFALEAVQVVPEGGRNPAHPLRMPDVVKKADIDATMAKFDPNARSPGQPLHSGNNFSVGYNIRKGHSGPWESHTRSLQYYFVWVGTSKIQLGGEILNPKEDLAIGPGEMRGTGISGAREYSIGPGDIVLIPPNIAHHVDLTSPMQLYFLVSIPVE